MQHIHLKACASTQTYLRENLNKYQVKEVLVSTSNQTDGYGRQEKYWKQYSGSLAFSFTLQSHKVPTLTSIEIGLLTITFLNEKYDTNLKIKWPNDILNINGEKIGGIICHTHNKSKMIIAGLGINFSKDKEVENCHDFPASNIKTSLVPHEQESLPLEIYKHILNNRMDSNTIMENFDELNFFHKKQVKIADSSNEIIGNFVGLNQFGMALVQDSDNKIHELLSGTLRQF